MSLFAAGRFCPRFGQELAGLDVGPVDKAVVEEDVEALDVHGQTDIEGAGVVAGSQELSVGGGGERLGGCPDESRTVLVVPLCGL